MFVKMELLAKTFLVPINVIALIHLLVLIARYPRIIHVNSINVIQMVQTDATLSMKQLICVCVKLDIPEGFVRIR